MAIHHIYWLLCFLYSAIVIAAVQFQLNSVQTTLFVGYSHKMEAVPLHKRCYSVTELDLDR